MSRLRITWVKSATGYARGQRDTIRALGLRRLHQSIVQANSPEIQGMVFKVKHLVRVEEAGEHEAA